MVNDLQSALYECTVMHHRFAPKVHHFSYRVFYLWMDLDEMDELDARLPCFSRNRFNVFSFFDLDHLDLGAGNVKANLLKWLDSQDMDTTPIRHVRLLAFPRVLGHVFNPVAFFYCFDERNAPLCAVSQVTNTFREQKPFLLREQAAGCFQRVTQKFFYVSPFTELDQTFDFKLRVPEDKLEIHIDTREGNRRLLSSTLTGRRRPLTHGRLLWYVLKYPFLTLRVIFLIHWHAFLLWMQRVPFQRKAAHPEQQKDLLKPHRSIASKRPH